MDVDRDGIWARLEMRSWCEDMGMPYFSEVDLLFPMINR
jgi:hypothetical protein